MDTKISKEDENKLVPIFRQRRIACNNCPTPCDPIPNIINLKNTCPLPESRWDKIETEKMGLGDIVEMLAKPVARILKMDCLDKDGKLKPESGCAKRRHALNRIYK